MLKLSWSSILRLGSLRATRNYSLISAPAVKTPTKSVTDVENNEQPKLTDDSSPANVIFPKANTGLVAAAFAALNADTDDAPPSKKGGESNWSYTETLKYIESHISKAKDVNSLLSIVDKTVLTRKLSLKIVSVLAEWSSTNKVALREFETDPRFLQLCRTLGRHRQVEGKEVRADVNLRNSEDLNTVLNITGDDEAARLISSLNVQQMIKVMSSLAHKKRRSTPLLRALAYNITKSPETLDLKKCADLFFAMAILNFPDAVLIDRICSDITESLPLNKDKSSVVGSIATSLGLLRHKDTEILDTLTDWMVTHADICRPHDIVALALTLGTLGHKSLQSEQLQKLQPSEISKPAVWLDYVWSLTVLDQVTAHHIEYILSPEFLDSLKVETQIPYSSQKKLLNINAYTKIFLKNYKGPFLSEEVSLNLPLAHSKEKTLFVTSLLDTLRSLMASEANVKKNCNSRMGFLYDAECLLDSNCISYPVDSQQKPKGKNLTKVAMLALDYHDICKQTPDPIGSITLYQKLLEAQGYKVLLFPYTDFNPKEKLVNRVKTIENKIKETVSSSFQQ